MEQSNQSKKVLLSVIGVAILVVAVVGVSFAFFNYARTGAQNSLQTGKIYFVSSETGGPISITNFFPEDENGRTSTNSSSVTVNIEGGTTYENGIDYVVSLVNVTGTLSNVPITVTQTATSLGATSGTTGTRYIAEVDSGKGYLTLNPSSGSQVIGNGHIDANANAGTNGAAANTKGTILINAGIASNVAITDTSSDAETSAWVNGRTVMTTTEWNALGTNPITFNVRVVANETPRSAS